MLTRFPEVTIPNTEVRVLSSSNAGQEYKIYVALPHDQARADKGFPAVCVLDAN
jgi:predicted alpha/beta superfamily hydrolase